MRAGIARMAIDPFAGSIFASCWTYGQLSKLFERGHFSDELVPLQQDAEAVRKGQWRRASPEAISRTANATQHATNCLTI